MNIRIILADDHKIVRDGLKTLIEKERDMEVVAEAEDGRMTVKLAKKFSPDVVIMDIDGPENGGEFQTINDTVNGDGSDVAEYSYTMYPVE